MSVVCHQSIATAEDCFLVCEYRMRFYIIIEKYCFVRLIEKYFRGNTLVTLDHYIDNFEDELTVA